MIAVVCCHCLSRCCKLIREIGCPCLDLWVVKVGCGVTGVMAFSHVQFS